MAPLRRFSAAEKGKAALEELEPTTSARGRAVLALPPPHPGHLPGDAGGLHSRPTPAPVAAGTTAPTGAGAGSEAVAAGAGRAAQPSRPARGATPPTRPASS
nr:atrophin-1-like [Aegilops tauschii subsp. strangulata]